MWGIKTGWGELFPGGGDKQSFGWWGTPPIPSIYIYIYKRTLPAGVFYTMKELRVHHINHVPKWPS